VDDNAYPNGNAHADTWELARTDYCGVTMRVSVCRGALILETIDAVTVDPMRPYGFRQFQVSRFPAPVFVPGDLPKDMGMAQEWLDLHKAHIRDAELSEAGA